MFGTPFIGLGVQQLAIGHTEYGLAISAAALAAVQGALALASRRMGVDRSQLVEAYAGLSVAFSAIAVPLALDTYFTSTVWAVQGLLLLWLGCRRDRLLALVGGALLQVLAAASFVQHLTESLPYPEDARALVNEHFLGALLLAATRPGVGLAAGAASTPDRCRPGHRVDLVGLGNRLVARGGADGDRLPVAGRTAAGIPRVHRGIAGRGRTGVAAG